MATDQHDKHEAYRILMDAAASPTTPVPGGKPARLPLVDDDAEPDVDDIVPDLGAPAVRAVIVSLIFVIACVGFFVYVFRASGLGRREAAPPTWQGARPALAPSRMPTAAPLPTSDAPSPAPPVRRQPRLNLPTLPIDQDPRFRHEPGPPGDHEN